jgi:ribonuclease P protein component
MMQRVYRLRRRSSFDVIYKRGKSYSNTNLVLLCLDGKLPMPKVGFVVGKKVGKAVVRNKVKRRLREIFRALLPDVKGHTSYVVVARSLAAEQSFDQLRQSLVALLVKANKLHRT